MNISEKAAYLKGLISGMEYDVNSREGKLFAGIIDLLEDISLSVLDLEDETATLGEYVEELDHDLGSRRSATTATAARTTTATAAAMISRNWSAPPAARPSTSTLTPSPTTI